MSPFAPVERMVRGRNKSKQLLVGVLFAVPLAIAVAANPPGWGAAGIAVAATLAAAVYYLAGVVATTDRAWKDIHAVAALLDARDLRAAALSEDDAVVAGNRAGRGQMGRLYQGLVRIHRSLGELVGQAHRSAEAARSAADELARGNVQLSQRAEDQAATLEQTAAAMEELSSTVKENAESCREASRLAAGATTVARQGSEVAQQAIATMDLIDRSSKRVGDIIGVIESIAFQTNILALNAAVEAARAGEQGRGFAVVASEVRSLAQRSAQAAKEIRGLIEESVGNVGAGTRLVHDAGRIIGEVVGSVEHVNELIGVVAVASREQASGVESVNKAITQLQGATQQTAAVVQDAAFSSVTLKEEAARLFDLVRRFRTDAAAAPAAFAPAKPVPAVRSPAAQPAARSSAARQGPAPAAARALAEEWREF